MQRTTKRSITLTSIIFAIAMALVSTSMLLPPADALSGCRKTQSVNDDYTSVVYVTNHNEHSFFRSSATRVYNYTNDPESSDCLQFFDVSYEIYDSFVIIDVQIEPLTILSAWLLGLNTVCQGLKDDGCLIMYVNNVEEGSIEPNGSQYTAFLDYVDIHVNTALEDLFIDNIFYNTKVFQANYPNLNPTSSENSSPIRNCIFVIDRYYAYTENFRPLFNYYLICALNLNISVNSKTISDNEITNSVAAELVSRNIYFVVPDDADLNYSQNSIHYSDVGYLEGLNLGAYTIVPIGNTESGTEALDEWSDVANELNSYSQGNNYAVWNKQIQAYDTFKFVHYLFYGRYGDNDNVGNYGNIYGMYDHIFHLQGHYESEVEYRCITNDDLSDLDNWCGRCAVSHKTVDEGEDGWISYYHYPIREINLS